MTRLITQTDRKVALEGRGRHQKAWEQSEGSATTRWAGRPHMLGRPAWAHCHVCLPLRGGLQPSSTTHLDHCFKSV